MAFMVLACLLAAIGVATNSPITIAGAMVVGPEFGPLAGIAVGLRLRRMDAVRRGIIALVAGFAGAVAATAVVAVLWRATGLVNAGNLAHSTGTEYICQPGWFSLITALVAGAAGMLSLTSAKSAALVGVFISVTTIPAAGNLALALVFGRFHDAAGSALQLVINLTGIVAAGYLVLHEKPRALILAQLRSSSGQTRGHSAYGEFWSRYRGYHFPPSAPAGMPRWGLRRAQARQQLAPSRAAAANDLGLRYWHLLLAFDHSCCT